MHTHLLYFPRYMETRRLCLKNERGNTPTASLRARFRIHNQHIGYRPIRDEDFRAVEQIAAVSLACRSLNTHRIGASIRLCQGQSANHLGTDKFGQILLFLFFGTVAQNIVCAKIQMSSKRHRNGSIGSPNAASNEGGHQEIASAPTIFFGNSDTCVALLREASPEPAWKIIAALDFRIVWPNLVSRKGKRALIRKLMLFREFKIHKTFQSFPMSCFQHCG